MSTPDEIWKDSVFWQTQGKKTPVRQADLGMMKFTGDAISRLKADPNWEIYGRYIEGQLKANEAEAKRCEMKLINMFLKPEDYGELKVKHAYNQGRADGLAFALSIAQTLIEEGEKALEESNGLLLKGDQA